MFSFPVSTVRSALLSVGTAAVLLAAVPAHADRQPNTNVGASERSAYATAVSAGTPAALRRYIESYPDTPKAAQLLQMLIEDCAKRLQGAESSAGTKASDDPACNLSELIAPAAGTEVTNNRYVDPPTENSSGRRASPN